MTSGIENPARSNGANLPIPDPLPLVERGLAVFNLPPGERVPRLKNWPNRWVRDADYIRQRWPRGANIGVACKPNNLLVVDLDRHDEEADGIETWRAILAEHGQPWPETFTVSTPRAGQHLYFWAPTGSELHNTTGTKKSGLGPGVDTRGPYGGVKGGGYVVGPTSIWDGRTYDVVKDLPIVELPAWLADLLANLKPKDQPPTEARPVSVRPQFRSRYVEKVVGEEVQRVLDAGAAGGGRNNALNDAAYNLGKLVGGGLLAEHDAVTALYAAADSIGLVHHTGERQVHATIRSGLTAGMRKPRTIAARGSK